MTTEFFILNESHVAFNKTACYLTFVESGERL